VAEQLGTAPIAVGQACGRNPLPIVVPCHRVVGADSLRGYMYRGLQEKLLELERKHSR
jgi:methylated-DNA-[protein]-cysteine S-methyltransferase